MIEKKAGFIVCTRGWRQLLINGNLHILGPGMMQLNSPAFMIQIIDQSPDFESISFIADIKVLFPMARTVLPIMVSHGLIDHPVFKANDAILQLIQRHTDEESRLRTLYAQTLDPDERVIINKIIEINTLRSAITAIHMVYKMLPKQQTASRTFSSTVTVKFLLSLQRNYMHRYKVSWYAAEANMSTGHFSKTIHDTMGKSPSQLIMLFTIQNAKLLLGNTSQSIKEISAQLGFPEQFTFRKYFKNYTGVSPKEYRRQQAGNTHPGDAPDMA
ncbi:MAG: helix-turn-helix domain-containing protein [Muribaculaceae bacterium]